MPNSKILQFLQTRNSTFYFRRKIPQRLHSILHKKELVVSLGTNQKNIALLRAAYCAYLSDQYFRLVTPMSARTLSERFKAAVAKMMAQSEQQSLHQSENSLFLGQAATPETLDQAIAAMDLYLSSPSSRSIATDGWIATVTDAAMSAIPLGSDDDPELARAYTQRAQIQSMRNTATMLRALQVDPGASFIIPPGLVTSTIPPAMPAAGPDMLTAWQEYEAENKAGWKPGTHKLYLTYMAEFTDPEFIGNKPVSEITRDDIITYRAILQEIPKARNKSLLYRGKSIAELRKMNIPQKDKLSDRSIDDRIIFINQLFKWCHAIKDYQPKAITVATRLKKVKQKERVSFTSDDIKAIFSTNNYAENVNTPYKFWFPLIGLYAGARIGEIALLKPTDVTTLEGIDVFSIQVAKTEAGKRYIPIHPVLIKMGLLSHAQDMRKSGRDFLFPDLRQREDKPGTYATKWFTDYRRKVGIPDTNHIGQGKAFHSFRHTFTTSLRQLETGRPDIALIQQMIGHEENKAGTTDIYTSEFPISQCFAALARVNHPIDVAGLSEYWEALRMKFKIK